MKTSKSSSNKNLQEIDLQENLTRESLARLINSFLASEVTNVEFEDQLDPYRDSDDPVINHVSWAVWKCYDDNVEHYVCLNKQEWDYLQRLLLILASDSYIQSKFTRHWSVKQLIALTLYVSYVLLAFLLGWGMHLLILAAPFGLVSIGLSYWKTHKNPNPNPYASIIFPFATFKDLEKAYRSTEFRKVRYPKHIGERRIRSPIMEKYLIVQTFALWLFFSPFVLLFQMQTESKTEITFVVR